MTRRSQTWVAGGVADPSAIQQPPAPAVAPSPSSRPERARTWRIEFPPQQKLLNANDRIHYRTKATIVRQLRRDAFLLLKGAKVPHLNRARIDCVYEPPDRRRRDAANWHDSAKPCVDGFVDAGLLADDSSAYLEGPFMHIGDPHPGGRLVFVITDLTEGLPDA